MAIDKEEAIEGLWDRICEAYETDEVQVVADRLGLAYASVYKWRTKLPSILTLLKIAKQTNVSLHWLLANEGPQHVPLSDPAKNPIVQSAERIAAKAVHLLPEERVFIETSMGYMEKMFIDKTLKGRHLPDPPDKQSSH